MDIKVDLGNVLPGSHESTSNAARWLREYLGYDLVKPLFDEFEEYFNCRIDVDDRNDWFMEPNKIIFETSADMTMFVLKWT
jgi:hypothetical protein